MAHFPTVYKIVLIGAAGVGKTAFARNLTGEAYMEAYIPTLGVEVHSVVLDTDKGQVILNIWDCAGHYTGDINSYYTGADAAIAFYDNTSNQSAVDLNAHIQDYIRSDAERRIVICATKSDLREPTYDDLNGAIFVSAKNGVNCHEPIQKALRMICGSDYPRLTPRQVTTINTAKGDMEL